MKTVTLTKRQVLNFINKQPGGRRINFNQYHGTPTDVKHPNCGCLLVHIFRDRFKSVSKTERVTCAFDMAHSSSAILQLKGVIQLPNSFGHRVTTYAKLRRPVVLEIVTGQLK